MDGRASAPDSELSGAVRSVEPDVASAADGDQDLKPNDSPWVIRQPVLEQDWPNGSGETPRSVALPTRRIQANHYPGKERVRTDALGSVTAGIKEPSAPSSVYLQVADVIPEVSDQLPTRR